MPGDADRLAEYNARRDFDSTPEPEGAPAAAGSAQPRFVVQKHAARRLHYDFRLEWAGVLLSWAVTKGPSDDPREKRLAVRTEDHPLSYADFEGTIPKGQYGGGTVMLWDQGTWHPGGDPAEGLENGKLAFTLRGRRMQGGWALIRLRGKQKRENWLLIKERDTHASRDPDGLTARATTSVATGRDMAAIAAGGAPEAAPTQAPTTTRTARRPRFRALQLATLYDAPPEGDDWLHETKYDGYRALVALGAGGTRLFTRSGHDWTDRFAALAGAFDTLACQSALSQGGPLVFQAFDLLALDGADLTGQPLGARRERLAALLAGLPEGGPVRLGAHVVGSGPEVFSQACKAGAEGIISKRIDAPYRGRRTKAWRKIKCAKRQEFVIGGFRPSDTAGRPFASLLIGTQERDGLRYRGRIGTGFSEADFARLRPLMTEIDTSPFVDVPGAIARGARWLRPDLVAEVSFAEFTADGHVRHGSFLGLRGDKDAGAVTLETPAGPEPETKPEPEPETATGATAPTVLGVAISSAARRVFPDAGCTKLDIARHYARVGDRMITLAGHRPLSLFRCPGGLGQACFFQKHGAGGMPDALARVAITQGDGATEDHLYATRPESLVAAAQMGTVEFHIWGARTDRLDRPDRLVFDLDPDEGLDWPLVRAAAFEVRDTLDRLGLQTGAIVTGGKGIHVWAPLRRSREWDTVKLFAKTFAHVMAAKAPDRYTATMSKKRREGRIFIDWLRNERGATAIAPYSLRARQGAPVAVPVTWDEVTALGAANGFRMADMAGRLAAPCPAAALQDRLQSLSDSVIDRLDDWANSR